MWKQAKNAEMDEIDTANLDLDQGDCVVYVGEAKVCRHNWILKSIEHFRFCSFAKMMEKLKLFTRRIIQINVFKDEFGPSGFHAPVVQTKVDHC